MEVDARLKLLLRLAGEGDCLADVGSDHGYLAAAALESGLWQRCAVTDISPFSVEKAVRNLTELGYADRCRFAQGDGFAPLQPGEAGVAVAAGMGGDVLAGILSRGFPVERAVLQPMTGAEKLRLWLNQNGFVICEEGVAYAAGRWYVAMAVQRGQEPPLTLTEQELGRCLLADGGEDFVRWLAFKLEQVRRWQKETKGDSPQALAYRQRLADMERRWTAEWEKRR